MGNIKTKIECHNIAPIENLCEEIQSTSLRTGIFANNGSGKTYISRLFRILENTEPLALEPDGVSPTDKLLKFGRDKGLFVFKITDDTGVKEDLVLNIEAKKLPQIPKSYYLYHTFNQDYVDNNIRALNYEKSSDVQGYILGKAQIDMSEDENKLKKINDECDNKKKIIEEDIDMYLHDNVDNIRDIKRLQEYKEYLNSISVLNYTSRILPSVEKSMEEYIQDFDKIKSVPEDLSDISSIDIGFLNVFDDKFLSSLLDNLKNAFTLSSFSEEFKKLVRSKQMFIEEGLRFISIENRKCPFCGQTFNDNAEKLIDNYTKFLNDKESDVIKQFKSYVDDLNELVKKLSDLDKENLLCVNSYNDYKTKYIPSCAKLELFKIDTANFRNDLKKLSDCINNKINSINNVVIPEKDLLDRLKGYFSEFADLAERNNKLISDINSRKNDIKEESRTVRRNICKAAYLRLVANHDSDIKSLNLLLEQYKKLSAEIGRKRDMEKVSKKTKVSESVNKVLNYFFNGKYKMDNDSFRLVFDSRTLGKEQAKNVLSEGEKNIIAFAYYIGDVHTKITNSDDYNKLFFIIDDPISSMDYDYVYTMCGIIRGLKDILPELNSKVRFIVFTHNNDFMRILSSNNIVQKKLLLSDGSLKEFNENFTVPYICHLLDIYNIARKGMSFKHTTANSIRHIIETLVKFQNVAISDDGISTYIKDNFSEDKKSYTFINDLSHGGWASEQAPLTEKDYKEVCEAVVEHIERKFPNQITFCEKFQ